MDFKRVSIIHLIITVTLALVLGFAINLKVGLGIIYGSLIGYLNFYLLNKRLNNLTSEEIPNLRKVIKDNRNFRLLVMIILLLAAVLLNKIFDLIAVCFSVLINMVSIRLDLLIMKINERRKV